MAPIRTNEIYNFDSKSGSYRDRRKNVLKAMSVALGIPNETQINTMEEALKFIMKTKETGSNQQDSSGGNETREQQLNQKIADAGARIEELEKKLAEAYALISQLREKTPGADNVNDLATRPGSGPAMAHPPQQYVNQSGHFPQPPMQPQERNPQFLQQQMMNPVMFPPQMYPFHNGFNPMMVSGSPFGQMQPMHPFSQQMMSQQSYPMNPTFSGVPHQNPQQHQTYPFSQEQFFANFQHQPIPQPSYQQTNESPLLLAGADQMDYQPDEQDPQMDAYQELALAEDQAIEPVFGLTNAMVERQTQVEQSQTEVQKPVRILANVKLDRDALQTQPEPQLEKHNALPLMAMVKAEVNSQNHTEPQDQQPVVNLAKVKIDRDAHPSQDTEFNLARVKREM